MNIAAMSDLHGFQPKVPAGVDLVIIAGDVCVDMVGGQRAAINPQGQAAWFEKIIRPWVRTFVVPTFLTWGNHDWVRHSDLVGLDRGNLHILVDELVDFEGLRIWLTPWTNRFMNWNWMKPPAALEPTYAHIPAGLDILVSHQPPYGCGDRYPNLDTGKYEHIGSKELADAIRRVRPQLVICGHLHNGYGVHYVDDIPVYNVSVVNDSYQLVNPVTILEVAPREKGESDAETADIERHRRRD